MTSRRKKLVAGGVVLVILLAMCGGGLSWAYTSVATHALELYSQTYLRGHYYALDAYAEEHDDVYPPGFGVLLWSGAIAPEMLQSPHGGSAEIDDYDWDRVYAMESPDAELDEFTNEHSSYVVLAWGQERSTDPGKLIVYERLKRWPARTPMAFADGTVRAVPNEEAERLIREAGHEPVWADDLLERRAP